MLHSLRANLVTDSDAPKVRELLADYSQVPEQGPALLRALPGARLGRRRRCAG
jgi:hypothetical protein